ncbi:fungal-specific transcription factor domain-containing protein [Thelonectria olida]|uniref:Fungal-specific transcription factor domain-containing protein n=1 Tax=Thelonectria olida TaxID=1576542 RepID=A0A9P9AWQ2_9HYPO|nr:fungal-specific transcription factor domain-containing protein [Thelonectria olida]
MFTVFGLPTPAPSSGSSDKASPPPQPRQKRAQVSRACDWCRLTRVKCDSVRPCRNCKDAKRECVNAGRDDFKSVAAATKVKWKGIATKGGYGPQYGPSSLHYFTHRLSNFTNMTIPLEPESIQASPMTCPTEAMPVCGRLQRQQQDVFLDLFWQGYHAIYPVLDENSFRRHYESLWDESNSATRKPCPLVDSALALCIQFGSTYMSCECQGNFPGRDYFLRAQFYLSESKGSPSLMTAQCYFLNSLYLIATSQFDAAYTMIGTAIRTAQSLGVQHDIGNDASQDLGLGECRKRLWSCLVMLDIQISMHLGRPFAIPNHQQEDSQPDSDERAASLGPTYTLSPDLGINWLSFQHERRRLFNFAREIHDDFYAVCEDVLNEIDAPDFYPYPSSREKCAQFLFQQLKKLKEWAEQLPDGLKTPRRDGVPFSIDRSALDLSHSEPLWLQRQRLILELEYHTFAIILRRPFISFLPTPALGTLSSDNHCITAGNSALAVTNILHQVLRDTDILTGWYQVVDWQLNALFLLAGFTCGYPICPLSPSLRRTIPTAAAVLDMVKATEKAELAHKMRDKCFEILRDFGTRIGITNLIPKTPPPGESNRVSCSLQTSVQSADADLSMMDIGQRKNGHGEGVVGVDTENLWAADIGTGSLLWGDLLKDLGAGMMLPSLGEATEIEVTGTT